MIGPRLYVAEVYGRMTLVFHTTPTSELVTRFPLALVPTLLVPLAFMLHVVSLWQLLGARWAQPSVERRRASRWLTRSGDQALEPAS